MLKRLLAILLLCASPAFATTYYVDDSGTGANCTDALSPSTAHNTIAEGLSCLSAGDTLIIGDGTYAEGNLDIPAGTAGFPTIVRAENANGAIVRPTTGGGRFSTFWLTGDYVTIDGLDLDCANFTTGCSTILFNNANNPSNITLKNGTARNGKGDGTDIAPGSCVELGPGGNHVVQNMDIYDCGYMDSLYDHGIYLMGNDNITENNRIRNVSGFPIHLYHGCDGMDGCPALNNIIRNNRIWAGGNSGMLLSQADDTLVYNNEIFSNVLDGILFYNDFDTASIFNNTIYGNGRYCVNIDLYVGGQTHNSTVITNNICRTNTNGPINNAGGISSTCTYNLGVSGGEAGSNSCSSTATSSNPLFANTSGDPSTFDFTLLEGSPAIDAGTSLAGTVDDDINGNARPLGDAWDMGANEADEVLPSLDLYVSTTGSNGGANNCQNINSPCLTVAYTLTQVSDTSIVNMCIGACNGSGTGTFTESVAPGDFPDNTTLQAYPGEVVTFGTVYFDDCTNVAIKNFIIDARVAADSLDAVDIQSCVNVLIEGMDIGWALDHGISGGQNGASEVSDNITIRDTVIHDWVQTQTTDPGGCAIDPDTCGQHGIYPVKTFAGADEHWYLENVEFYNESGANGGLNWAVHIYGGVDSIGVIEMNGIKVHDVSNAVLITACNTCYISNFELYNNDNSGLTLGVFGTTAVNPAAYNGSIYDSGTAIGYGDYNATIKNVVAYGNATNAPQLIQGSATLTVVTSITDGTDPDWASPSTGNFTITSGSALYNAGTDLSATIDPVDILGIARPQDGTWDIGARELQAGGPALSPGTRGNPMRSFIIQ